MTYTNPPRRYIAHLNMENHIKIRCGLKVDKQTVAHLYLFNKIKQKPFTKQLNWTNQLSWRIQYSLNNLTSFNKVLKLTFLCRYRSRVKLKWTCKVLVRRIVVTDAYIGLWAMEPRTRFALCVLLSVTQGVLGEVWEFGVDAPGSIIVDHRDDDFSLFQKTKEIKLRVSKN